MKKLYGFHIFLMIVLFFLGQHFLVEYNAMMFELMDSNIESAPDYGIPSRNYAICSLPFFAISILVGLKTIPRMRITGGIFLFGGIGYVLWCLAVISAPKNLGIHETFPAWGLYIIVSIILSIIGIFRIDKAPLPIPHYEDQILDDTNS